MSRLYTLLVLLILAPARLWAVEASTDADSVSSDTMRKVPLLTIAPPHERYYNVTMRTRALGIGGILLGEEYLPRSTMGVHTSPSYRSPSILATSSRRKRSESLAHSSPSAPGQLTMTGSTTPSSPLAMGIAPIPLATQVSTAWISPTAVAYYAD